LRANAQIAAPHATLREQGTDDAVERGFFDQQRHAPQQTRGAHADGVTLRIEAEAAGESGFRPDVGLDIALDATASHAVPSAAYLADDAQPDPRAASRSRSGQHERAQTRRRSTPSRRLAERRRKSRDADVRGDVKADDLGIGALLPLHDLESIATSQRACRGQDDAVVSEDAARRAAPAGRRNMHQRSVCLFGGARQKV